MHAQMEDATHLVLWTDPLNVQYLRQPVQASMKIVTELHEVLDVEDVGEVDLQTP